MPLLGPVENQRQVEEPEELRWDSPGFVVAFFIASPVGWKLACVSVVGIEDKKDRKVAAGIAKRNLGGFRGYYSHVRLFCGLSMPKIVQRRMCGLWRGWLERLRKMLEGT